jgi:hypothetical protein
MRSLSLFICLLLAIAEAGKQLKIYIDEHHIRSPFLNAK